MMNPWFIRFGWLNALGIAWNHYRSMEEGWGRLRALDVWVYVAKAGKSITP